MEKKKQTIKTRNDMYAYIKKHTGGRFNKAEIKLFVSIYERMIYESLLNQERFSHPGLFAIDTRVMPPVMRADPNGGGVRLLPERRRLRFETSKPIRRVLRKMDDKEEIDVAEELRGFDDLPPEVLEELAEGLKRRRLIEKVTQNSEEKRERNRQYRAKRRAENKSKRLLRKEDKDSQGE